MSASSKLKVFSVKHGSSKKKKKKRSKSSMNDISGDSNVTFTVQRSKYVQPSPSTTQGQSPEVRPSQEAENVPNLSNRLQLTKSTSSMTLHKYGGPSDDTSSKPTGITEFEILKASHK